MLVRIIGVAGTHISGRDCFPGEIVELSEIDAYKAINFWRCAEPVEDAPVDPVVTAPPVDPSDLVNAVAPLETGDPVVETADPKPTRRGK